MAIGILRASKPAKRHEQMFAKNRSQEVHAPVELFEKGIPLASRRDYA
jgi:hypothetical protein